MRAPTVRRIGALGIVAASMLYGGINQWTSLGPDGGNITALVVDTHNTSTIYAGTADRGVFKSVDGGASWSPASSAFTGFVLALAIDTRDTGTLYAGVLGVGVVKSTDGGANWQPASFGLPFEGDDFNGDVQALVIDPSDSTIVYAGTESGVYKTTDGGASWIAVNSGLPRMFATSLTVDPQRSQTLYVGGSTSEIFKTTDGGVSWLPAGSLPPDRSEFAVPGVPFLLLDPESPDTLYAGSFSNGVLKSVDGGATWRQANFGLPDGFMRTYGLAIDPREKGTLYALMVGQSGSLGRLFRTADGGDSWFEIDSGLPASSFNPRDACSCAMRRAGLTIDPQDSRTLYIGTDSEGVFQSVDSGTTWNLSSSGLRAKPVVLATAPDHAETLYAADDVRVYKSADGGKRWAAGLWGAPGEPIGLLAADPGNPDTLYATAGGGEDGPAPRLFKSADGGISWLDANLTDGAQRVAFDVQVPGTVYASTGVGLYKTTDGGGTWTELQTPTRQEHAVYPTWSSIAVDPRNSSTIYLAAMLCCQEIFPPIYKSTDGGSTWSAANPDLAYWGDVFVLAIDPQDSNTVYAGSNDGILKTADGGANWQRFNSGMPENTSVLLLVIDPRDSRMLYAGTNHGVFRTADAGASWSAAGSGLPGVLSLALDPRDSNTLYAGTSGGGYAITFAKVKQRIEK